MTNKVKKYLQFNITRQGNKYKVTKIFKHETKKIRMAILSRFGVTNISLVELLINIGLYKQTLLLKLIFVLTPFALLTILDNIVIAVIMTIFDIFCCAFIFSILSTERRDAILNGKFDYGKYKYIKSRRESVAILLMFFISSMSIIIGHYLLKKILPLIIDIVID